MSPSKNALAALPSDWKSATLLGRAWIPGALPGPSPITVRPDGTVVDLAAICPTISIFLEQDDAVAAARTLTAASHAIGSIEELLANSRADFDEKKPRLLAPCDLQALKAAGVTFVASTLERVIEEQARGDATRAESIRARLTGILGDNLASVRPGSEEAARIKQVLVEQGAWSQYLEVGIGPDAEIFTKSQPLSAVGHGALIGLHPKSTWNNPEPRDRARGSTRAPGFAARRSAMT